MVSTGVVSGLLSLGASESALAASPQELKKKSEARKAELRAKMEELRKENAPPPPPPPPVSGGTTETSDSAVGGAPQATPTESV